MLTVYCPQRTSTWGLSERTEKLETRLVGLKSTVTPSWLMKSYARILAERKDGAQQNINTPTTIKKSAAGMIFISRFRRVSRPLELDFVFNCKWILERLARALCDYPNLRQFEGEGGGLFSSESSNMIPLTAIDVLKDSSLAADAAVNWSSLSEVFTRIAPKEAGEIVPLLTASIILSALQSGTDTEHDLIAMATSSIFPYNKAQNQTTRAAKHCMCTQDSMPKWWTAADGMCMEWQHTMPRI